MVKCHSDTRHGEEIEVRVKAERSERRGAVIQVRDNDALEQGGSREK